MDKDLSILLNCQESMLRVRIYHRMISHDPSYIPQYRIELAKYYRSKDHVADSRFIDVLNQLEKIVFREDQPWR